MPSAIHNVVVELLEAHPETLAHVLALHGTPISGTLVPMADTQNQTLTLERRVDRAFLVGPREAPESFMLAEVQLDPDDDKRFSLPLYMELSRSRYRCEGALVVLTFSETVRQWIKDKIAKATGEHGTWRQLSPTVAAIDAIDRDLLLRPDMPHLSLLAVAAHMGKPAGQVVAEKALDITLSVLPPRLAEAQIDAILGMADRALRAHLETRIMEQRHYYSDFFRKLHDQAVAEGEAEGVAKGEAEGLARGKAEGLVKGKAEGKAEGILAVLAARGIPVSSSVQTKILACTDLETLDVWLRRAALASTAAAVVRAVAAGGRPRAKSGSGRRANPGKTSTNGANRRGSR